MKVNLVFEGGGILGVSFVGAYKALIERGYTIERCAGTSAGSIISSLIIAGYTPEELINVMNTTDFSQFFRKTKLSQIPLIGKPLSVVYNKGIYDIDVVEKWMEMLLANKGISTFKDVMVNGQSKLKVVAADITDRKLLILPDNSDYLGIKPEDLSIAKAVAMSCSIPLFFTPIKYKKNNQINYIVDGGIISTFPIWIFDVEGIPKNLTLGFKIKDKISNSSVGKTNIVNYVKDLMEAALNKEETTYVRDERLVRTITIDFDNNTKSIDFDINKERLNYLYNCGYNSTMKFFINGLHYKIKFLKNS